jgi:hypothetical protein
VRQPGGAEVGVGLRVGESAPVPQHHSRDQVAPRPGHLGDAPARPLPQWAEQAARAARPPDAAHLSCPQLADKPGLVRPAAPLVGGWCAHPAEHLDFAAEGRRRAALRPLRLHERPTAERPEHSRFGTRPEAARRLVGHDLQPPPARSSRRKRAPVGGPIRPPQAPQRQPCRDAKYRQGGRVVTATRQRRAAKTRDRSNDPASHDVATAARHVMPRDCLGACDAEPHRRHSPAQRRQTRPQRHPGSHVSRRRSQA